MKGSRVLTDEEVRLILNELKIRDRVMFLTCLTFGTRISEALALTFADVAGNTLYIRSSKGSDNQGYPISSSFRKELNHLKRAYHLQGISVTADLPLFVSQKGKYQRYRSVTRQYACTVLKRVARKIGLDSHKISPASGRKTMVSRIYSLTGNCLLETKLYSRHRSLANLEYYIKTTESTDLVTQLNW